MSWRKKASVKKKTGSLRATITKPPRTPAAPRMRWWAMNPQDQDFPTDSSGFIRLSDTETQAVGGLLLGLAQRDPVDENPSFALPETAMYLDVAQKLLNLESVDTLRIDPLNSCKIQISHDNGATWLDFFDLTACAADNAIITNPAVAGRNTIHTQTNVAALEVITNDGWIGASINSHGENQLRRTAELPTPGYEHWGAIICLFNSDSADIYYICKKTHALPDVWEWIVIPPPYVPPTPTPPPDLTKYLVKSPNVDGDNGLEIDGNHFGLSIDNRGLQSAIGINQVSDQFAINAIANFPGGTMPPLQLGVASGHNSAFLRLIGGYGSFDAITTAFAYRAPSTTLPTPDASQYGAIMISGGAPVICLYDIAANSYSWQPLGASGGGTAARPLNTVIPINMLPPGSAASGSVAHLPDGTDQITENIPLAADGKDGKNGDSGLLLPVINNQIDSTQAQSVLYNATAKQLTANLFKPLPPQVPPTPPPGQDANCLLAANIAEDFKEATLAGANTAQTTGSLFAIGASVIGLLLLGVAEVGTGGAATPFVVAIAAGIVNAGGANVAASVTDTSVHALQQDIFCAINSTHLIDQPAIDKAKTAIYNDSKIAVPLQAIFANMLDAKGVRGLNQLGATQFVKSATCDDCPIPGYDWQIFLDFRVHSYGAVLNQANGSPPQGFVVSKGFSCGPSGWILNFRVPMVLPSGPSIIKYCACDVRCAVAPNSSNAHVYVTNNLVMIADYNNPLSTGEGKLTKDGLNYTLLPGDSLDCGLTATDQPGNAEEVWFVSVTIAGSGQPPTFNP